jgi:hypothetical protein
LNALSELGDCELACYVDPANDSRHIIFDVENDVTLADRN